MDTILPVTFSFLLVLLLALLVERIMEVLMAVWGLAEWKINVYRMWNRWAERLRTRYERKIKSRQHTQALDISGLLYLISDKLLGKKRGYSGNVPIISADLVRHVFVSTLNRMVASIIGCVLCVVAQIDFVQIISSDLQKSFLPNSPSLRILLSGILIGLGSEPVHKLIKFVEKRRPKRPIAEPELKTKEIRG
jgi:hypothetical protein